ncbi:serine--tRNA ligase, partial [Candidatus Woesearchaeota archaeon]|nr:serine--tRNA ligase [Candidatus Woesearchaeota archaeon]
MLDIRFIADNPDIIKENIKKKFQNDLLPLVDSLIKDYKDSLKLKKDIEELRHRRNSLSQEINKLLKENKPIEKQKKEARQIP